MVNLPHTASFSQETLALCKDASTTLTSVLAQEPHEAPYRIAARLFPKPFVLARFVRRFTIKHDLYHGRGDPTPEDLDRACQAGRFGDKRPSDLFLKIYSDTLLCLDRDPLAGMCSPPLMGTTGTIPLTIISVIPDILKHYYDCIVRAEREVILATNYWQPSNSVNTISDALRELSKRAGARGVRIIVKIMWDRGTVKQAVQNHSPVDQEGREALNLPKVAEIPHLDLEVINFHRPIMGTFHAKFLIIDRKMALLNSNNIQDRPNLEMMIHLEGPVVDSFYDMFLLSWHNPLRPNLPCLLDPPKPPTTYLFRHENPYFGSIDLAKASRAARALLNLQQRKDVEDDQIRLNQARESLVDRLNAQRQILSRQPGEGFADVVRRALEAKRQEDAAQANPQVQVHSTSSPVEPNQPLGGHTGNIANPHASVQRSQAQYNQIVGEKSTNETSSIDPSLSISTSTNGISTTATTPVISASPSINHLNGSVNGGSKSATPEKKTRATSSKNASPMGSPLLSPSSTFVTTPRQRALSEVLNAGALSEAHATVEDSDALDDFNPHTLHKPHDPVPIAMVCRKPHGLPGHQDIRVPQDAAWLAGFRYAEKSVFIQTPTFNAKPVVAAALEACRRGIKFTLFVDLGFNDKGESMPFQGGTNEENVLRMFAELRKTGHEDNFLAYWYVGKDQIRPLNAVKKQRNCHVKFMQVDDKIAIQGNGNQDTQSWYHSQEINVMIDSEMIVADFMAAIHRQQNTGLYGRIDNDGIWRKDGKTIEELEREEKEAREAARRDSSASIRSASSSIARSLRSIGRRGTKSKMSQVAKPVVDGHNENGIGRGSVDIVE